jgi:putative PIN family toxin of toxin-antitoxin system
MRVMVDTNIIISAMVFKSAKMSDVLRRVVNDHELCLSEYTIEETKRILSEKFAGVVDDDIATFFKDYPYTLIVAPVDAEKPLAKIRDAKDYPVLHAAITSQIDLILTGDKDFFDVRVDRPEILAPLDFLKRF